MSDHRNPMMDLANEFIKHLRPDVECSDYEVVLSEGHSTMLQTLKLTAEPSDIRAAVACSRSFIEIRAELKRNDSLRASMERLIAEGTQGNKLDLAATVVQALQNKAAEHDRALCASDRAIDVRTTGDVAFGDSTGVQT